MIEPHPPLKKCPKCLQPVSMERLKKDSYAVKCFSCPLMYGFSHRTKLLAAQHWNKRPEWK
jgi:hypothetical protein